MWIKKTRFCLGLLAITFYLNSPAHAACIGIGCTCSIAATNVSFGTYSPFSSLALNTTGTISVTCSTPFLIGLNVSYVISLNKGSSTTFSPRVMKSGANQLNYNLYTNSLYTLIWGDGTSGTNTVSDAYILNLISVTRNYTAYALLPALQNVVPGTYSDTITATVTF